MQSKMPVSINLEHGLKGTLIKPPATNPEKTEGEKAKALLSLQLHSML